MMHTMTVFLQNNTWYVRDNDPAVAALFGTDTIPTPYTSITPEHHVLAILRERNPDVEVTAP